MLFKKIALVDEFMQVNYGMYLGTEGEKITYLDSVPPGDELRFGETFDGKNKLLVPGFINTHSHAPMNIQRGFGENLSLMDWLNGRIFPFEARLTSEDVYYSAQCSIAEMLRFGIVSVSDHYMFGDANCRAFLDSGIKGNLSLCFSWFGPEDFKHIPAYSESEELFARYANAAGDRIKLEYGPHAEYTTTERILRQVAELAAQKNTGVHIHIAETAKEVEECRGRHQGKSPVQYLADCGLLNRPATAAHCVHLDEKDVAILKEKKVNVASCPKSNLKLASGFCPVRELMEAGVNISLGTDSVASNNNLNMLEEMKIFALIHKGAGGDPVLITPEETLYAATRAGAITQRRPDCGLLKEGFKADIAVFDIDKVYMKPVHSLMNNLIYAACGNDVCMTMADGKILYRDGEFFTLDIERIYYEAEQSRGRIVKELT
jgi:5-methylthioadenosine/S-adenosylhomocysteine deaminase